LSIGVWSISTALHAFAQGILSFGLFRAMLGVSEAGNWPGAAKANAEWFPTKERALAQGIFNSGAAIGALVSIPLISGLALILDWKAIFVLIGLLGLLWLIPWFAIVKSPPGSHPWITEDERQYIISGQKNQDANSDGYAPDTNQMLKHKESWAVIIMSAAIDPIWWLFVIWVPTYLVDVYQFDLKELAKFGWIPYFGAMLGAFFGGFLAKNRLNSGWSVDKTRKLIITLGCLIMLPALLMLSNPGSVAVAITLMFIILFGFQTAIGNVQTLPSDFFAGASVGRLSGYAGMAAKLTAGLFVYQVPGLVERVDSYSIVFVIGAILAITAMLSVWLLCPKIEPLSPKS